MGRIFLSTMSLTTSERMTLLLAVFRFYSRKFKALRRALFSTRKNLRTFRLWPGWSYRSFGQALTRFLWRCCTLQRAWSHHRQRRNPRRLQRQRYRHCLRMGWIGSFCVQCLCVKVKNTFRFAVVIKILGGVLGKVCIEAVWLIQSDFHF